MHLIKHNLVRSVCGLDWKLLTACFFFFRGQNALLQLHTTSSLAAAKILEHSSTRITTVLCASILLQVRWHFSVLGSLLMLLGVRYLTLLRLRLYWLGVVTFLVVCCVQFSDGNFPGIISLSPPGNNIIKHI